MLRSLKFVGRDGFGGAPASPTSSARTAGRYYQVTPGSTCNAPINTCPTAASTPPSSIWVLYLYHPAHPQPPVRTVQRRPSLVRSCNDPGAVSDSPILHALDFNQVRALPVSVGDRSGGTAVIALIFAAPAGPMFAHNDNTNESPGARVGTPSDTTGVAAASSTAVRKPWRTANPYLPSCSAGVLGGRRYRGRAVGGSGGGRKGRGGGAQAVGC